MLKYFIIYLIIINIIAFIAMYIDKKRAKMGKWRIKEYTLFILALIGGSIGAIAGMYTFRHKTMDKENLENECVIEIKNLRKDYKMYKTKKARFVIGFPAILIIQILLGFMIYTDFIK